MDIYALTCRHMSKICPCRKENCSKIRKWPVANKFRKTQKCNFADFLCSWAENKRRQRGRSVEVNTTIIEIVHLTTFRKPLLTRPTSRISGNLHFLKLSDILWQFPRPQNHKGPPVETERSKTERGSDGPGLALSAGAHTVFLLVRGGFGYVAVACKIFRQGN